MKKGHLSVILSVDGTRASRQFRVPLWAVRVGVGVGVALGILIVAGVSFYGPLVRQAARVPGLQQEVARLETDNARIRDLAAALDSAEARYGQLRELIGPELVPDPMGIESGLPVAPVVMARAPGAMPKYESGASTPSHWPMDVPGYITRGIVAEGGSEEPHAGLDIAVSVGTLVRAVGGGRVVQTGQDPEYGVFVLIEHPGGYTSRYGHLSAVTTLQGATINAGEVVGRSGNTGRSSAPHLHIEIRKDGAVVDPTTLIQEGR